MRSRFITLPWIVAALFPLSPVVALAQTPAPASAPVPTEFPSDAQLLTGDALTQAIAGRVLQGRYANGMNFRVDYKSNGYVFLDSDRGRDSGKWRIDGSKLCADWKFSASACLDVRVKDKLVYVQRLNGEILELAEKAN